MVIWLVDAILLELLFAWSGVLAERSRPFGPCVHSLDRYHKDTCHFIFNIRLLFPGQSTFSVHPVVIIDPTPLTNSAWKKSDLAGSPAAINMVAAAALNSTGYPVIPLLAVASLGDVSWVTLAWAPDPTYFMCSAATVRYVIHAPDATIGGRWLAVLNAHEFCLLAVETIPAAWGPCQIATWASLQMDGKISCPARHWATGFICPLEPDVEEVAAHSCNAVKQLASEPWTFPKSVLMHHQRNAQQDDSFTNSDDEISVLNTVLRGGSLFIIDKFGQSSALVLLHDNIKFRRQKTHTHPGLLSTARVHIANTETIDVTDTLFGELILPSSIPLSGSRGRLAGRFLELWYFGAAVIQTVGAGSSSIGYAGVLVHIVFSDATMVIRLRLLVGCILYAVAFVNANTAACKYHTAIVYLLIALDSSVACRLGDAALSTAVHCVVLTLTVCYKRLHQVMRWRQGEVHSTYMGLLMLDTLWIQGVVCFPMFVTAITHMAPGFLRAWIVGVVVIGIWCSLLPVCYSKFT
jgi:hypothetical protein